MGREKSIITIHGNNSGIVGNDLLNPIINVSTNGEVKKSKEERIQEFLDSYANYFAQIDKLDISKEEKKEAKDAIYTIQDELNEENPNVEKIKSSSDKLKKSSEIASICGAIFGLLQLFS
jgi:molecular chaperone DnaK (HSP70)